MIRTVLLLLALSLALAACQSASVPMASPDRDAAGRQFAPPPPGMAAVYFFNPSSESPVLNVRANGREIGQLGTQTWMRAEFAPGIHTFHCWGPRTTNAVILAVSPGERKRGSTLHGRSTGPVEAGTIAAQRWPRVVERFRRMRSLRSAAQVSQRSAEVN